jgi:hypothetical protein
MKTGKITFTGIMLFALVFFAACATVKSQYDDARETNTISAYEEFLSKNPSGEYATLAQARIESLNFEKAKTTNSVAAYQRFIQSSNSELFKNYATQRLEMIYKKEFLKVKEIDTVKAYEGYITSYPKSEYVADGNKRIESLVWVSTIKQNNAVGYYKYLNNCKPCGQNDQQARRRFSAAVKLGVVIDLWKAKNRILKILSRNDIVVIHSRSDNKSTQTGSMRFEDLATADDVWVNIMKEEKTISAIDLAKGNYESVRALRLKNRVPISPENTIGFSTIFFYSKEKGPTEVIFIAGGKGYYFQDTDPGIY